MAHRVPDRGGRRRSWRSALAALGCALTLVAAAACGGEPAPEPSTTQGTEPVALGVFRGTDPADVRDFESWVGHRLGIVMDFPARDTWEHVRNPDYLLEAWDGTGYRLSLGIPLLPEKDYGSMAAGARGEYDEQFRELGRTVVAHGRPDTVIRLGWEFNLEGWRWFTSDPEQFVGYWRRVVGAMRSVPGQHFQFDWNVNNGYSKVDTLAYYPGDDVVDFVGVDVYDQGYHSSAYPYPADCDEACRHGRQVRVWEEEIYGGDRGLRFWTDFARDRGKPLSLPEWGLWDVGDGSGGGDNPTFIRQMTDFIRDPRNNVAYASYFEWSEGKQRHSLRQDFPEAGQVYRRLWEGHG